VKPVLTMTACAVLLAACAPPKAPAPAAAARFATDLPMTEVMDHVIDPAAFAYWHGSGTEITGSGERDLSPTTEAGWVALENAAAVLIEAGNTLQVPGRPRAPEADWDRYAQALSARAVTAKAAAEKRDKQAVFDEGAKIYEVCTACHRQYVINPMLADQARSGAPPSRPLPPWPADLKPKSSGAKP
jgi:hypothetical protein